MLTHVSDNKTGESEKLHFALVFLLHHSINASLNGTMLLFSLLDSFRQSLMLLFERLNVGSFPAFQLCRLFLLFGQFGL